MQHKVLSVVNLADIFLLQMVETLRSKTELAKSCNTSRRTYVSCSRHSRGEMKVLQEYWHKSKTLCVCVCVRWRWNCSCRQNGRRRRLGRPSWSRRGGTGSWRLGSPRASRSSSQKRFRSTRACAGNEYTGHWTLERHPYLTESLQSLELMKL